MAEIEKSSTNKQPSPTNDGLSSTEFRPKSAEEQANEKKSRKWELVAGAIGDGIASLSNLFFASKGAPIIYGSTSGKKKASYPSLIERIYGRHKEADKEYKSHLSARENEQEKKRKEAERLAKENAVIEAIHEDYKPKEINWDNDAYIDFIFDKFRQDIEKKTTKYNDTGNDVYYQNALTVEAATFADTVRAGAPYPNDTKVMRYINGWDLKGRGKKYKKQAIISHILGSDKFEELDEDFLNELRATMKDMDKNFVK